MKQFFNICSVFILIFLIGCKNSATNKPKEIDVNQFPVSIDLNGKEMTLPEISSIGISEIKVLDSLLIVSVLEEKDFWHIYSLPDLDSVGRFFNVGNGPHEFTDPIPCFQSSFYSDHNNLFAYIPLLFKQEMVEVNLSNLLRDKNYEDNAKFLGVQSDQMPIWAYALDQSRYIQAVFDPDDISIQRTIKNFSDQSIVNIENGYLNMLNSRTVESMEDLQLLITSPAIGRSGKIVAEIPGYSNKIIIYKTDGAGGACVSYKNILPSETKVKELANKNLSFFGGGYGHDDFFAFIRNEIKDDKIVNQYFDFLSWDGCPLGTINTGSISIRRFDIDRTTGALYCLDGESDTINAYNIKSFLKDIKALNP